MRGWVVICFSCTSLLLASQGPAGLDPDHTAGGRQEYALPASGALDMPWFSLFSVKFVRGDRELGVHPCWTQEGSRVASSSAVFWFTPDPSLQYQLSLTNRFLTRGLHPPINEHGLPLILLFS